MYRGHFFTLSLGCAFFCVGGDTGSLMAQLIGLVYMAIGLAEWKVFIDRRTEAPNAD